MIAPNMATMLGFVATDAPIAPATAARARCARSPRRRSTASRSTATRRPTTASLIVATGAAAAPPIATSGSATASAARCARGVAPELAQAIVRDGEGATKFITITVEGGRDVAECDRVARAIAHLAAGQDRVLRVRSEPRPHRLRDRQRRRGRSRSGTRVVLARRRRWSSIAAAAPASYREEDGQRVMEQARDRGARRARARRCERHGVDVRSLARLRQHQRRLPELKCQRAPPLPISRDCSRVPKPCSSASKPCCRRRAAEPDWSARAFRWRKRGQTRLPAGGRASARDPTRRSGRDRRAEARDRRQHAPVRRRAAGEQRAADRLARHRQVVAGQGDARRSTARRACA